MVRKNPLRVGGNVMALGAVKAIVKYSVWDMLGFGSLPYRYSISDRHDSVMYLSFTIGLYDNKNNAWKKFGN
jgi:hypothetical protein